MPSTLLLMIITFIICTLIFSFLRHLRPPTSASYGFKTYPFFGTLPEFLANRHRFLDWMTEVLSLHPTHTAVFFRPGGVHGVITAFPDNVEHVLKSCFTNYPKGPRLEFLLHDFLGSGIFNADGELWRLQRKTASLGFTHRNLTTFVLDTVRDEISDRLLPLFKEASESGRIIDLQTLFVAGTETTSIPVEWAMAELLRNPEKMKKSQAELKDIIGKGNPVEEPDIARLPYLQAVIKETFRLHPPLPLLVPRKAVSDVSLCGITFRLKSKLSHKDSHLNQLFWEVEMAMVGVI